MICGGRWEGRKYVRERGEKEKRRGEDELAIISIRESDRDFVSVRENARDPTGPTRPLSLQFLSREFNFSIKF